MTGFCGTPAWVKQEPRGRLISRRRAACCIGWLLTLCLLAGATQLEAAEGPSGEYDFDRSKGLLLYHNEQYGEAERYLNEAFKANPDDSVSGYYLGQSLLRLKRYQEAEDLYREILRRNADDARARMGLGMALYHRERYKEALANLGMAEQHLASDPLLYYYQGLAAADQQLFDQASDQFERAGALDPDFTQDVHYQRASTLYSQGKAAEATAEFRSALQSGLPTVAQPSTPFTPLLGATPISPLKRWDATFAISAQYDSNVVLLPGGFSPPGGATGISHKDDFVTALAGYGEYRLIQNDIWTVGAGYGFFQNIHARLSAFDVQNHTPTLYVQRRLGLMQVRLQYLFDHVTVGGDSYLVSNALQPTVTVPTSERTYTQAFMRYQYMDFKDDRFAINSTRDGVNWMVGAMQYLLLADHRGYLRVGYTFDANRTGGGDVTQAVPGQPTHADWAYLGHRFSTGMAYQPGPATHLHLAFDYYRQNYSQANSFSFAGSTVRKDNVYLLTGTAVRDLRSWLWLAFQYSYTRDQSNIQVFDYSRHIVSFTLGGTF